MNEAVNHHTMDTPWSQLAIILLLQVTIKRIIITVIVLIQNSDNKLKQFLFMDALLVKNNIAGIIVQNSFTFIRKQYF